MLRNQRWSSQPSTHTLNMYRMQGGSSPDRGCGGGTLWLLKPHRLKEHRKTEPPPGGPPLWHHPPANPSTKQSSAFHSDLRTNYTPGAFFVWEVKKRGLWVTRGRCRIIASTLVCLVCDKTLTCLFKTVQMLITMHVALLAFYFNMLIYVEIDVCVVPNWSHVMICDRKFNLKTTCVKSIICDSFPIYISDINFYFLGLFLFRLLWNLHSWVGLPCWMWEAFSEHWFLPIHLCFSNLQCEIIETKNAHVKMRILLLLQTFLSG